MHKGSIQSAYRSRGIREAYNQPTVEAEAEGCGYKKEKQQNVY
jgi:hypothetical protein